MEFPLMVQASPLRSEAHLHVAVSMCPTCDQPVPNEKMVEINVRLKDQESQMAARLNREYEQRIAEEKEGAEARLTQVANDNAKEIERIKTDAAKREVALRHEVKSETEASVREEMAQTVQRQKDAEQAAEASRLALVDLQKSSGEKITNLTAEFASRETAIRIEAATQARSELQQQLDNSKQAAKTAQAQFDEKALEAEGLKTQVSELKTKETLARQEGKAAAEEAARALVEEASKARGKAEADLASLNSTMLERFEEQRGALEKAKDDAVNIEKVKSFEERIKLETQLKDLARKLEQKTADELGEGAEVKLLEDLQARFPKDRFRHVGKGNPGADIIQEVLLNGRLCGKIIYDSKNRNAWRNEYISKLRKDQVAEEADHAILSTLVLPAGTRHLHIQDGVIIANPARVMVLVDILREQVIRNYRLRLSNESKAEKKAALYDFITGELSSQLFKQIELRAGDILDLDVKEQKAHKAVWEKRGQLTRSIQKAHADLSVHIERVLGTVDAPNTED